jgi:hypothetical protein
MDAYAALMHSGESFRVLFTSLVALQLAVFDKSRRLLS